MGRVREEVCQFEEISSSELAISAVCTTVLMIGFDLEWKSIWCPLRRLYGKCRWEGILLNGALLVDWPMHLTASQEHCSGKVVAMAEATRQLDLLILSNCLVLSVLTSTVKCQAQPSLTKAGHGSIITKNCPRPVWNLIELHNIVR